MIIVLHQTRILIHPIKKQDHFLKRFHTIGRFIIPVYSLWSSKTNPAIHLTYKYIFVRRKPVIRIIRFNFYQTRQIITEFYPFNLAGKTYPQHRSRLLFKKTARVEQPFYFTNNLPYGIFLFHQIKSVINANIYQALFSHHRLTSPGPSHICYFFHAVSFHQKDTPVVQTKNIIIYTA